MVGPEFRRAVVEHLPNAITIGKSATTTVETLAITFISVHDSLLVC
jgi:hypothetical protein